MEYFLSYDSLHLYFDEKGFNRKNCIIKNEKQQDVFFTSELNQAVWKNYWRNFYCRSRIATRVYDKTGKEVLRFIRHRDGKKIYAYSGDKNIGYMIKNRNKLCHSKYSIFDCQNNELMRIKMPTDRGEYSNKYQVFNLNNFKIGEITREFKGSCYSSINFLLDIDARCKALLISATILLNHKERHENYLSDLNLAVVTLI
ncbi:hypothetical protein HCN44_003849 [Aphidius gifuensis]|uniref:Phospholipid scramblase n=1 Tax=Aphidius gifuensis TaxID=684658 RepID=A0A834XXG4_APHGI|nr:hypothetical protein HCN44_003849 [Aphidius gifuensis]